MPVVSMENVSVFIPLILRGKVSGSGAFVIVILLIVSKPHPHKVTEEVCCSLPV